MATEPLPRKRTANLAKIKHKKFVDEMMKNGLNPKKAYLTVYPESSENSAIYNSSRIMQDKDIQADLAKRCESITPDKIVDSIGEIAWGKEKTEHRLRALEMLAKVRSLFKSEAPSQQINVLAQFDTPEARKELESTSNPQIEVKDITPSSNI